MGGSNENHTILSMDLNQYENEITIGEWSMDNENSHFSHGTLETDIPSYTSFQYISDVGGTAGLGMFREMEQYNYKAWIPLGHIRCR